MSKSVEPALTTGSPAWRDLRGRTANRITAAITRKRCREALWLPLTPWLAKVPMHARWRNGN